MSHCSWILKTSLVLLLALANVPNALADDDEGGSWWGGGNRKNHQNNRTEGNGQQNEGGFNGYRGGMVAEPPQYKKECSSCHMAYPAGLLPAGSWQHLMGNLSQHFGSDASLDAASASAISQYLVSSSGTYKRVNEMPPQDRITQSYWFTRKHNKHVDPSTWARQSIGGPGNCVACHQGAEQGNFNEHSVRIPY